MRCLICTNEQYNRGNHVKDVVYKGRHIFKDDHYPKNTPEPMINIQPTQFTIQDLSKRIPIKAMPTCVRMEYITKGYGVFNPFTNASGLMVLSRRCQHHSKAPANISSTPRWDHHAPTMSLNP